MMAHCFCLFLLKHKKEGDNNRCRCLLCYNKTKEEDNDDAMCRRLLLLKHKEKGDGSNNYHYFVHCNKIKEERKRRQ